jgi:hypothetical protein
MSAPPFSDIAGYRDAPLILASVSRAWCDIALTHPPLWSTIIVDQSENDCLERIHLFFDRSGKELLDIILLDHVAPTLYLKIFITEHADRFKTLVGLSAERMFAPNHPSRMEPLNTPASLINCSIYKSIRRNRRISTIPIPKCLRHVQLQRFHFDSKSLIQFTHFHNLESLYISIAFEPENTEWDRELRFELLRHLHLNISHGDWSEESSSAFAWVEWLGCPALVDLDLVYSLRLYTSNETYPRLEACLLRFRSMQNLRVHMDANGASSQVFDASEFHDMHSSVFAGRLELVQLTFFQLETLQSDWVESLTKRFFSIFFPNAHLVWPYGQFPDPTIFTDLKTMHISYHMKGNWGAWVDPEMTRLVFPFLEELYLEYVPGLLDLLHAPCLTSLHIDGFIPSECSDLRHINNSTISSICLKFGEHTPGLLEIYLPPVDNLQLDLQIDDLFHLNVHSSWIQAVTINADQWNDIICPPIWTVDCVSEKLGIVTALNVKSQKGNRQYLPYSPQGLPSFLKPFVYLKHLTLPFGDINAPTCIDQLAQYLSESYFLPGLEVLVTFAYPIWPDFFQYIHQRQIGFLSGQFQTALKEISVRGPIHGALLEYLGEALAGKYTRAFNVASRHEGSKEWPAPPFSIGDLDGDGLLCCYCCYRAGLEVGCAIHPSKDAIGMLICDRHPRDLGDLELITVSAP